VDVIHKAVGVIKLQRIHSHISYLFEIKLAINIDHFIAMIHLAIKLQLNLRNFIISWFSRRQLISVDCSFQDRFEDTKGVIRSRKSKKDGQYNDQKKRTKGQTIIYKTLSRILKIEQHEPQ